MRLPRVKFTVRGMVVLVAVAAMALMIVREFGEGIPPRFVLRGIPRRVERLRPGMTRAEVRKILGLDRPWYLGGTSARPGKGGAMALCVYESYLLRPMRFVDVERHQAGFPPKITVGRSAAGIQLRYRQDEGPSSDLSRARKPHRYPEARIPTGSNTPRSSWTARPWPR